MSESSFEILDKRIDDIVAFQRRKYPWYRDTSLIISVAAFFISVVTTVVSWYRTYQQDINAIQLQLSNVLQQTHALKLQNMEYFAKYKDDPGLYSQLSVALNERNVQLAREAYSLARSLGNSASAIHLIAASQALSVSDVNLLSEELLKKGIDRSENSVEYVGGLRLLGWVYFRSGRQGEGNAAFKKATEAFYKYTSESNSEAYVNLTQAYTYSYWAQALQFTDCKAAKQHFDVAKEYWLKLPGAVQGQVGALGNLNCP